MYVFRLIAIKGIWFPGRWVSLCMTPRFLWVQPRNIWLVITWYFFYKGLLCDWSCWDTHVQCGSILSCMTFFDSSCWQSVRHVHYGLWDLGSTQACHAWNIEECYWLLILWLDSCKVGPPSCLSWHWHLKKGSESLIWRMCTSSFEFQIFCSWSIQFVLSSAVAASFCKFLILSNIQLSGLLREGRQPTLRHLWKTQVWYHSGAIWTECPKYLDTLLRNSFFRWWDSCWCCAGTL
jgi:hypothetical protein